ncbi:unnamed protein product [Notodromas monacha]|uniref:NIDO domain-containing protein n=1 Tax=Notodromas monacha TaxID=399045 RepID=A0A7R9BU67_9CRUS|nr:unnamed protein product [Notodromas monacha]CAG0920750.1 unnamed protein product [Notodromas monacha]
MLPMTSSSLKHETIEIPSAKPYSEIKLRLTIKNLNPSDFEYYYCVAKNTFGDAETSIRLQDTKPSHHNKNGNQRSNKSSKSKHNHKMHEGNSRHGNLDEDDDEIIYAPTPKEVNLFEESAAFRNFTRSENDHFMSNSAEKRIMALIRSFCLIAIVSLGGLLLVIQADETFSTSEGTPPTYETYEPGVKITHGSGSSVDDNDDVSEQTIQEDPQITDNAASKSTDGGNDADASEENTTKKGDSSTMPPVLSLSSILPMESSQNGETEGPAEGKSPTEGGGPNEVGVMNNVTIVNNGSSNHGGGPNEVGVNNETMVNNGSSNHGGGPNEVGVNNETMVNNGSSNHGGGPNEVGVNNETYQLLPSRLVPPPGLLHPQLLVPPPGLLHPQLLLTTVNNGSSNHGGGPNQGGGPDNGGGGGPNQGGGHGHGGSGGEHGGHHHHHHQNGNEITKVKLLPSGPNAGDTVLPSCDDCTSSEIALNVPFSLGGIPWRKAYIATNGIISFERKVRWYAPSCYPRTSTAVAPFWSDADTRHGGYVSYRQTQDPRIMRRIQEDVSKYYPRSEVPEPRSALIVTWSQVQPFGSKRTLKNTFQAILVSVDRHNSFVILNYDNLQWISGANNRRKPAFAGLIFPGYDSDEGALDHVLLPLSCSTIANFLSIFTNTDKIGKYVYWPTKNRVKVSPENNEGIPDFFMPFGRQTADEKLAGGCRGDCVSDEIEFSVYFVFGSALVDDVYIHKDGKVVFPIEHEPRCGDHDRKLFKRSASSSGTRGGRQSRHEDDGDDDGYVGWREIRNHALDHDLLRNEGDAVHTSENPIAGVTIDDALIPVTPIIPEIPNPWTVLKYATMSPDGMMSPMPIYMEVNTTAQLPCAISFNVLDIVGYGIPSTGQIVLQAN